MGWIYSGIILASSLISRILVFKKDPSLIIERGKFNQGEGTQSWDRLLLIFVSIIFPIICLITAGLDHRFRWPQSIPLYGQLLAAAVLPFCSIAATWAMVENPFFFRISPDSRRPRTGGDQYRALPVYPPSRVQQLGCFLSGLPSSAGNYLGAYS